jgi:predicted glycosyltransferase
VVHAGAAAEVAHLLARAGPTARSLDLAAEDAPFPAAAWLQGASSILAGGGYNTFWEARWLGYAARTTFVPFPRSIDDQAARVGTFGSVPFLRNGADTLARAILAG